jgi:nicotinamidase-related amidase
MLLRADSSLLILIDVQERLLPAMADPVAVETGAARLMRGARILGVPLLATEQYPRGLGPTVPGLAALATPEETVEKLHFSCAAEPAVQARLALMGPRRQAVLCGIEAHVCVLQSALGLAASGWAVAVVEDAVSSRRAADRDAGLRRMAAAGVTVATAEMVLFEWLGRAGTDAFRDIHKLIK